MNEGKESATKHLLSAYYVTGQSPLIDFVPLALQSKHYLTIVEVHGLRLREDKRSS